MATYWLDLFTPRTWEEAKQRDFKVTGFRLQRWPVVSKIKPGDVFICYLTELGRFSGILKAVSGPYKDEDKARQICFIEPRPSLQRSDTKELRNRILELTQREAKELGIGKSTLHYLRRNAGDNHSFRTHNEILRKITTCQ